MTRTKVVIAFPNLVPTKQERTPTKSTVGDILKTIPYTAIESIDRVVTLIRAQVQTHPTKVYFQDTLDYDGKTISLFDSEGGRASAVIYNNEDPSVEMLRLFTSHFPEEIRTNTNNAAAHFLHEALHVLTLEALNKGEKDIAAGVDSKNATLYKQLTELQKIFEAGIKKKGKGPKSYYTETRSNLDVREFVANLSNEKFRKAAESIKVDKKSVLTRILDAILEFFSGESNVYNVTFKVLEDFYSAVDTNVGVTTKIDLQPVLTKISKVVDSLDDHTTIAELLNGVFVIPDYKKNKSLNFKKVFELKDDADKLAILEALYKQILGGTNSISFAISDKPTPKLITNPGGALNTAFLPAAIEHHLEDL